MDNSKLDDELRQIKRRRIEIRGTKAALDLEDFNLDDRQHVLENLLQASRNITPNSSADNYDAATSNFPLRSAQTSLPLSTFDQRISRTVKSDSQNQQIEFKTEPTGTRKDKPPITTITIDDDDEEDRMIAAQPNLRTRSLRARGLVNSTLESCSQLGIFRTLPHETKTKFKTETESPSRPTKIVTLKYRSDRHWSDQGLLQAQKMNSTRKPPSESISLFSPSPDQADVGTPLSRNRRIIGTKSGLLFADAFRDSLSPVSKPPASIPLSPPPRIPSSPIRHNRTSNIQPTILINTKIDTPPCACLGRNRNCRTCRGTPAVIAEGRRAQLSRSHSNRSHPHNPFHSGSNSPSLSPRPVGRRTSSRPATYHIAEFEEMSDSERHDLEMRFCRRLVTKISDLLDQYDRDHNLNLNLTTDDDDNNETPWSWIRTVTSIPRTRAALVNDLKALVRRRPVAREDDNGVWDGSVLVSRCRDADEFFAEVDVVLQILGVGHPRGCCVEDVVVVVVVVVRGMPAEVKSAGL